MERLTKRDTQFPDTFLTPSLKNIGIIIDNYGKLEDILEKHEIDSLEELDRLLTLFLGEKDV